MVHAATPHRQLTVEEYLAQEQVSSVRHEYVSGEVHALAGASERHNRIAGNIFAHLWSAARGTDCRVYMSDMKLRASDAFVYYPDVMVVCDPGDADEFVRAHPCLVVEVLSPSTAAIDVREKLFVYRGIPTLRAYVIVYQDQRRVVRHWRDEQGAWWTGELINEGRIPFPCPETTLTFDDIYAGIDL